jgi:putative peptidoglycan lipid II flippase
LSAGFYNLGIIAGILLFHEEYGIYSAAFGVIFGLFLHLGLRLIDLKGLDFKIGFALNAPKLKEIFVLSVPKTLGLVVWQFSLLAYNVIGYSLVAGSISSFNLARNVQSFAVSLFGIAVATAVFPYLVDHKELGESEMLQQKVEFTILQILFYTLPACAGLAVLSLQTSQFLFGRGAFSPEAVLLTAGILFYFSFSIPFESLMHLFSRIFYAFKNTWTPVLINFVFLAINLSLSIYLAKIYGAQAFSIAFTIGNVIQVGLLYLFLSRYLKLNIQFLITQIFKLFLATAGMTLVVYYIQDWNYILVIAVGVVVYFVQTKLLGMIRFAGLQRFNFLKKYEFFS